MTWHCHELWYRSQTRLRPGVAVALASGYSSDLTLSLGTSMCRIPSPKKEKIKSMFLIFSLNSTKKKRLLRKPIIKMLIVFHQKKKKKKKRPSREFYKGFFYITIKFTSIVNKVDDTKNDSLNYFITYCLNCKIRYLLNYF